MIVKIFPHEYIPKGQAWCSFDAYAMIKEILSRAEAVNEIIQAAKMLVNNSCDSEYENRMEVLLKDLCTLERSLEDLKQFESTPKTEETLTVDDSLDMIDSKST